MPLDNHSIRRRRLALKLSQREAAERAGFVNGSYWSRLEREHARYRNPRLDTVLRVARVLGCQVQDIIG